MSEHELFTELRAERKRLRQAKLALKDARRACKEAEKTIEKILAQIDSGKTGRPILDAIAAAQGNGQPATLANRVRTVLDLPRVPLPQPTVTAADREPIRKRRKAVKP